MINFSRKRGGLFFRKTNILLGWTPSESRWRKPVPSVIDGWFLWRASMWRELLFLWVLGLHACDAINEIFPFWIFLLRGHFQNGWKSNRILVGELFPSNFRFLRSKKNSHLINSLRKCISCYPGVTMCLFNSTMSLCKYVNMLMLHNSRYVRIYLRMNGRLAIWTSLLSCLFLWILWVFWADLWLLSSFLVPLFYPQKRADFWV